LATISRSAAKQQLQERQRGWLRQVMAATGLKPTQIAREAGVSDTTLSRLLNNPDYTGTLSEVTIERIKTAYRVPGPGEAPIKGGPALIISEAERVDVLALEKNAAQAVNALAQEHKDAEIWRLHTSSLENAGYLPGDLVVLDPLIAPHSHDAVCVNVTEWSRGGSEMVWRIYEPPFLTSSTSRHLTSKPLLLDNDRIKVRGVIVGSIRPHRLSSAS
jgi:transcriptional regulator with XRE-family HTH domain